MGNEHRFMVERILPGPGLDGATELIWVAGHAFVNAAKHEQVVDRHLSRAEGVMDDALRSLRAGRVDEAAEYLRAELTRSGGD